MRDLQRRLTAAGFACFDPGVAFGPSTRRAVEAFQTDRGLDVTGTCEPTTWNALVEAGFELGDRLVYLTSPMLRGDDVADLQLRLGALGFDAGRVDGIFGSTTESAVHSFQQQIGLVAGQVLCLDRVAARPTLLPRGGTMTVPGARERNELRPQRPDGGPLRVGIVHRCEANALAGALEVDLSESGATVGVVIDPEWPGCAARINELSVDLCIAISLEDEMRCELGFFEVPGFTSYGGRRLAEDIASELPVVPGGWSAAVLRGGRSPIVRETRAPTVHLRIGPQKRVTAHHSLIAAALHRAIRRWEHDPAGLTSTSTSP